MRLRIPFVVLLAGVVLSACAPAVPVVTPTPAPTFSCTPEAVGAAYECDQRAHDEMVAKDADYARAEVIARAYLDELAAIYEDPTHTIAPETQALLGEEVLWATSSTATRMRESGERIHGPWAVGSVRRAPGLSRLGSVVSIYVCADWSQGSWKTPGRPVVKGFLVGHQMYFGPSAPSMKLIIVDELVAEKC